MGTVCRVVEVKRGGEAREENVRNAGQTTHQKRTICDWVFIQHRINCFMLRRIWQSTANAWGCSFWLCIRCQRYHGCAPSYKRNREQENGKPKIAESETQILNWKNVFSIYESKSKENVPKKHTLTHSLRRRATTIQEKKQIFLQL